MHSAQLIPRVNVVFCLLATKRRYTTKLKILNKVYMQDLRTKIVLWMARTINPQIYSNRKFSINLEELRQLPEGTLGYEVAQFLDQNGFEPIDSGDWIQRTHDIWHVLTGLQPSKHDEFMLQAFTRAQVFRPSSTILVLVGLITRQINFTDIIKAYRSGKLVKSLVKWDIESEWQTTLAEIRQKIGVLPLNSPK